MTNWQSLAIFFVVFAALTFLVAWLAVLGDRRHLQRAQAARRHPAGKQRP